MARDNYYELLGLTHEASNEEIRAAWRTLSMRLHPDQGGSATLFRLIEEAYRVLSNPDRREEYDRSIGITSRATRRVTPDSVPTPDTRSEEREPGRGNVEKRSRVPIGMLIAGVLVGLAVILSVVAMAGDDDEVEAGEGVASTTGVPSSTSVRSSTTATARRTPAATQDGVPVPQPVIDKVNLIKEAASQRDWEGLRAAMAPDFSFTFGIATDPIEYWKERLAKGDDVLADLVAVLSIPPVLDAYGDDSDLIAFPYHFSKDPFAYTAEDVRQLAALGYTDSDLEDFRAYGSYLGWRAIIDSDGNWLAFIAGD